MPPKGRISVINCLSGGVLLIIWRLTALREGQLFARQSVNTRTLPPYPDWTQQAERSVGSPQTAGDAAGHRHHGTLWAAVNAFRLKSPVSFLQELPWKHIIQLPRLWLHSGGSPVAMKSNRSLSMCRCVRARVCVLYWELVRECVFSCWRLFEQSQDESLDKHRGMSADG